MSLCVIRKACQINEGEQKEKGCFLENYYEIMTS